MDEAKQRQLINGNMRKSEQHRADMRLRVREAMTQDPGLNLRKLCRIVKGTEGTVGTAYHQFKRGEL